MTDLDKLDALAAAATPGPWLSERRLLDSFGFSGEVAAFIAACDPATIRDLVAAARQSERVIREYDKTSLTHDVAYEDVATELDWLRIALDPKHPMFGQLGSEAIIRDELAALHSKDGAS